MLKDVLHKILALPVMYDLMQRMFGLHKKKRLLRTLLAFDDRRQTVVDIGGGTGLYRDLWPGQFQYVCLDSDMDKLRGFASKYSHGRPVCSDAGRLCLKSDSVDNVFCSSMSHHIAAGPALEAVMQEMTRVIRPGGLLIFIDAVRVEGSRLNRFLWSLDRGEHPHTAHELRELISRCSSIETSRTFSICYDYVLFVARKQEQSR